MDNTQDAGRQLEDLLDAIARRDAAALKTLYDQTAPRLYALALKIVRERELAQEVLQDAYRTVWRIAADYRNTLSPPLAWLGLIVRSRALDALRRRKAAGADVSDSLDDNGFADGAAPLDQLASDIPQPPAQVQASQLASALHRCMAALEPCQREVFSLAYLRELSHVELSAQLRLPLGNVKTWIRRGLEQLRLCMSWTATAMKY
ncbi:MAG: sigma-70 family RNA polymerase sigma factor [Rhodoferax sp.]|nr:sigma-70 family RNA polymerase sigma factor [Rhodoferax sp.]